MNLKIYKLKSPSRSAPAMQSVEIGLWRVAYRKGWVGVLQSRERMTVALVVMFPAMHSDMYRDEVREEGDEKSYNEVVAYNRSMPPNLLFF